MEDTQMKMQDSENQGSVYSWKAAWNTNKSHHKHNKDF